MSRSLSSAMQAVSIADVVRPIFLVRMVFDSGETPSELNLWSGAGDLTYDSETYTGVGDLLGISAVTETSDMQASGINVTLTGVKSTLVTIAKDHEYQGRPITVLLGAFDSSGDLVADPAVIFAGFMDTMTIAESGQTSTISIACENKLIAFERAKERRYTAEDQKIDYPLKLPNGNPNPNYDAGFEFVTAIVEKEIIWGRPTPYSGSSGGGRGRYGCFVSGTQVLMANNTFESIETIEVGDQVSDGKGGSNTVVKIYNYEMADRYIYNLSNKLEITSTHPVLTTKGWKSFDPDGTKEIHKDLDIVGELQVGDVLLKYDPILGKQLESLKDVKKRKTLIPVYNLDVDGDDTFVAGGYVVHNK